MDFAWGDEADAIRADVRRFLAEHLPPEKEEQLYESGDSHDDAFVRALGERHWVAPDWEREGFDTLGAASLHILTEELTRVEAPMYAASTGAMVGNVIRAVGSDWLKAEILPPLLNGELTIALGMSEPEAGSDVANVQTKARQVDDGWVIDGQKMFTTNGHLADHVFLLARTDPESDRHRGLTTFLVPLDSPGIEVQPVFTVSGERTNITFYDEVHLDDRWRISDIGKGWHSLMIALQDEHSAPFSPHLSRLVEATEAWAVTPDVEGDAPIGRDEVRLRLMQAVTDLEVAQLLEQRTTWMETTGQHPLAEGPMSKLYSTEAGVRHAESLTALVGPDALRSRGDATAVQGGHIEHLLRFSLGMTIYAGSSEVQRNIIAQHRCGLPRADLGLIERDLGETAATLTRWFTEVAGVATPNVTDVSIPGSTGWSNETLFFEATLDGDEPRRLVARIAPSGYQVFPDDTFLTQHAVMRALAERTDVPMAAIHWFEADPTWFGQPFWIMDRIDGDIPTDVPPYSGEGWIHDSTPDAQAAVWWAGIDAMAAVHRVDLAALDLPAGTLATSGDSVGLHLDHYERFLTWAEDGARFDLARDALDHLRRTAPPEPAEGQALVWGDSRLSNLIFRDGHVVAVLDWEMCGIGDPLQDLGYWLFADWALSLGSGNQRVGGFPSWEETAAHWSEATGRSVAALDWYVRFGGLKFTVIMLRMGRLLAEIGFVPDEFARDNLISQHLAKLLEQ